MPTALELASTMRGKSDQELLKILSETTNWSEEALQAAQTVLSERKVDFQEVNLSKITMDPTAIRNELDPSGKLDGIKGWLQLYTIRLKYIGPLFVLGQMSNSYHDAVEKGLKPDPIAFPAWICLNLVFVAFAIYVGIRVSSRAEGAIRLAKNFEGLSIVMILFSPYLLSLIASQPMAVASTPETHAAWVSNAIWFAYLSKSKRVRYNFPLG
jgi:hypothetical protein